MEGSKDGTYPVCTLDYGWDHVNVTVPQCVEEVGGRFGFALAILQIDPRQGAPNVRYSCPIDSPNAYSDSVIQKIPSWNHNWWVKWCENNEM